MKTALFFLFTLPFILAATGSQAERAPRKIRIDMEEFKFTPREALFAKGEPIALTLTNKGQILHEFESDLFKGAAVEMLWDGGAVEGVEIDEIELRPGKSVEIFFTPLVTGKIAFVCKQPGHLEQGMKGTISIQ